jgi:hypothetical protein
MGQALSTSQEVARSICDVVAGPKIARCEEEGSVRGRVVSVCFAPLMIYIRPFAV